MKTSFGKPSLLAFAISALPLATHAAADRAIQSAARDVAPFTLLTGPNLTSPPRGAPPAGKTVEVAPSAPSRVQFSSGTLTLRPEESSAIPVPPANKRLPSAESLRFDSTLHAPKAPANSMPPAQWKFVPGPAPKRD